MRHSSKKTLEINLSRGGKKSEDKEPKLSNPLSSTIRLAIQQVLCHEVADYKVKLENFLKNVSQAVNAQYPGAGFKKEFFISYAWAHENYSEDLWIQYYKFLSTLKSDLEQTGVTLYLDKVNCLQGQYIEDYVSLVDKVNGVILIGSKSLKKKSEENGRVVVAELEKMMTREKKESEKFKIFFIMPEKDEESQRPHQFKLKNDNNILRWIDKHYLANLKEILLKIYPELEEKINIHYQKEKTEIDDFWFFSDAKPSRIHQINFHQLLDQVADKLNYVIKLSAIINYFFKKKKQESVLENDKKNLTLEKVDKAFNRLIRRYDELLNEEIKIEFSSFFTCFPEEEIGSLFLDKILAFKAYAQKKQPKKEAAQFLKNAVNFFADSVEIFYRHHPKYLEARIQAIECQKLCNQYIAPDIFMRIEEFKDLIPKSCQISEYHHFKFSTQQFSFSELIQWHEKRLLLEQVQMSNDAIDLDLNKSHKQKIFLMCGQAQTPEIKKFIDGIIQHLKKYGCEIVEEKNLHAKDVMVIVFGALSINRIEFEKEKFSKATILPTWISGEFNEVFSQKLQALKQSGGICWVERNYIENLSSLLNIIFRNDKQFQVGTQQDRSLMDFSNKGLDLRAVMFVYTFLKGDINNHHLLLVHCYGIIKKHAYSVSYECFNRYFIELNQMVRAADAKEEVVGNSFSQAYLVCDRILFFEAVLAQAKFWEIPAGDHFLSDVFLKKMYLLHLEMGFIRKHSKIDYQSPNLPLAKMRGFFNDYVKNGSICPHKKMGRFFDQAEQLIYFQYLAPISNHLPSSFSPRSRL